jgi:hypothetical protein
LSARCSAGGEFAEDGPPEFLCTCDVHRTRTRRPCLQPSLGIVCAIFPVCWVFASGFTLKPEASTRPAEGRAFSPARQGQRAGPDDANLLSPLQAPIKSCLFQFGSVLLEQPILSVDFKPNCSNWLLKFGVIRQSFR